MYSTMELSFIWNIPIGVTFTMYINVINHTQHTLCDHLFVWQLVLTLSRSSPCHTNLYHI